MASYVQRSTVLARRRGGDSETAAVQDPTTFPFLRADLAAAPHTSSCGHVMHAACWQKYFDDVSESERRRYRARHPTSFDVEKQEFLCPLCRSLSNSVVPLIPQYHLLQQPTSSGETPQVENEESAEGVAAVVEQCDAMETTEELPPSPTQQEPTLTQEEEEEEGGASGEAMLEVDDDAHHTAVATTVTVVSSPSPSSTSSSTTELASAQSVSSDSTFMSVEEVIF